MSMIYHRIYNKLIKLVPTLNELKIGDSMKAVGTPCMMDLNLDVLNKNDDQINIALSHYYKHECGDMIPDPDIIIAVFPTIKIAEALSYQDIYGYHSVGGNVSAKLRKDLNNFLNDWLRNCLRTGYDLQPRKKRNY